MPSIVDRKFYNGSERKIARLGLQNLLTEVNSAITEFELLLEERKNANGSAELRERIDRQFRSGVGWEEKKTGGIDWTKCVQMNGSFVCIGVEIQVSSRSDLLSNDLAHLNLAIEKGEIDLGVIVVPSDRMAPFLVDRCPRYTDALNHVERVKAQFSPLVIYSIEHDGVGPPLPKRKTNTASSQNST